MTCRRRPFPPEVFYNLRVERHRPGYKVYPADHGGYDVQHFCVHDDHPDEGASRAVQQAAQIENDQGTEQGSTELHDLIFCKLQLCILVLI